ncbi:MAG: ComF family protein [Intestinimonas sp.]|nr:ComF family protein [Intestinimonas sp.]
MRLKKHNVNGLADFLLDLLFPPRCPFCRTLLHPGEGECCPTCRKTLPWAEGDEAEQYLEFISLCVSPLWYRDQVRDCIRRYKFHGVSSYATPCGRLLARCISGHLSGRYDLITWVPLSARRKRERGYDQAELLARRTAEVLGASTLCLLQKVRHTPALSGLGGEVSIRRANVLNCYQVPDSAMPAGARVLLVDDVVTTGSTLSECARILRTAGATDVVCATLARARK